MSLLVQAREFVFRQRIVGLDCGELQPCGRTSQIVEASRYLFIVVFEKFGNGEVTRVVALGLVADDALRVHEDSLRKALKCRMQLAQEFPIDFFDFSRDDYLR